jgi:tetratricopeptide (TPR) repeat protein
MQCARHPDHAAVGQCSACLKAVCVLCMSPMILEMTCTSCAAPILAAQKTRGRIRIAIALLVAGLVVAAGAWAFENYEPPPDQVVVKRYEPPPEPVDRENSASAPEPVESENAELAPDPVKRKKSAPAPEGVERKRSAPAPNWGKYAGQIRSLMAALETEPCDRTKTLELSQQLLRANDNRGVLTRADAFFAACGDMPRLRWDTYEAHRRLSEWDLAIAEATKLIEDDRTDPDFWWWRGRAEALKGDFEAAVSDHRKAVELCPKCTCAWDLADALEELGRPCEAIPPLKTMLRLNENNKHLDESRVHARIADLTERGHCESGQGNAKIP